MHRLTRHCSPANVIATLALVLSLSGTAYAAATITGAQVKNSSLTGRDFATGGLGVIDLSPAARRAFKGETGSKGLAGAQGAKGATGPKGETGPVGAPANTRATWSSWDSGYMASADVGLNSGLDDWFDWQFPGCDTPSPNCHLNAANAANPVTLPGAAGGTQVIDLDTNAPAGGSGGNAGQIVAAWQATTLMAWANVTLLYTGEASVVHTRAQCWMTIGGEVAGPSVWVSAGGRREIETISLVGNRQVAPGTFDAAVQCRDADATAGVDRWQAIRANLTVMANEKV